MSAKRVRILLLLAGAWVAAAGCERCFYRDDGGATARRYYKACERGGVTSVKCDSTQKLPNGECQ